MGKWSARAVELWTDPEYPERRLAERLIPAVTGYDMFVDEVLRGTNTVERIAASSEILKSVSASKALVFAATHDIELTTLLSGQYDNYHFQEKVTDDEVIFDFKLYSGPATTRNAIKLLKTIGYNGDIINAAENSARYFLENGKWNC